MSPKADQKKHPQVKPSWNMEMRRRRADEKPAAGAESHGADGAVSSGAGCSGADGGAEQRPAADGAAGIVEETAIIGQELVPVAKVSEKGLSDEQLQVEAVPKSFQTPENQKTMGSPERLQLENKADLKTNEDSEKKGEGEDKGQMVAVPNGPPVSYGPDSAVSMPLFTPDQIAQANDPRNSSSLLPMTRESVMAPEFPRLPGFLHGLLPGYEQLYEVRQRELEWRSQMEMMLEPTFLFHSHPEDHRNQRGVENVASQPRRSDAAADLRAATDLRAAADLRAAGAAGADPRAAGADLRASSAAGADLRAAGADLRTPGADLRAAGASCSSSASTAAGDASERPRTSEPRRRRRGNRNLELFVTVMGQKYHCDVACKGLRNAHSVHQCGRCQTCGTNEDRPVVPLYGFGPDMPLHVDPQHARSFQLHGGEESEIRKFEPCAICMFGP